MIRTRRAGVLITILAVVLGACGGTAAPSPSTTPSPSTAPATATATPKPAADKITFIFDFSAFGYWAPWYAGIQQGFFSDENIDVTLVPSQGSGDAATKIGAGAAQFGLVDAITSVVAIASGTPITQIASHWQSHVGGLCYIQGRKTINGFKDLEGLKIGSTAGNAYLLILPFLMQQAGANPKGYTEVNIDASAATSALLAGQIDATPCGVSTLSSRTLAVKQQGQTMLFFAYAEHGLHALGHSIVVNNDLLKNKPDLVQRFLNAYAKSVVWSTLNQDQAAAAYAIQHPEQNAAGEKQNFTATLAYAVDTNATGTNGQFYMPPDKMKQSVDLANQAYQKAVDPTKAYTNDFVMKLPAALRQGRLP
jgi:NitT/TauT family transport system substrate-binding protein